MPQEKKCNGNRYNFKAGTEYCSKRHDCPFYVGFAGLYYNKDGKEQIRFNSMKEFRKCNLHLTKNNAK